MFEKISRAAEKAASGVGTSRRGFLGQLGRVALAAAAAAGGVLVTRGPAAAASHTLYRCRYACIYVGYSITSCGSCPRPTRDCRLLSWKIGTC